MAKKSATSRLDDACGALAATMAQIAERDAARNAALLAGEAAAAIAEIDTAIATLQHAARTEGDRILLLEGEARREEQTAVAKRQEAHIARFAKLLADADADAEEIQQLAQSLLKAVRRCIERRERALAGFSVHSSHANAAARAPDGAAMSANAVMTLLAHEFYRVSADPSLGGTPGVRHALSLPGARYPDLRLQLEPHKITPFAAKLRAASQFAVETLKAEIGSAVTAPAAPQNEQQHTTAAVNPAVKRSAEEIKVQVQLEAERRDAELSREAAAPKPAVTSNGGDAEPRRRTAYELKLAALLEKQAAAAADLSPEGEKAYSEIVSKIAALNDGALP